MIFNIIMVCVMYPMMFIVYAVIKMEGRRKGKHVFGCTLSKELEESHKEELERIQKKYDKQMRNVLLLFLVLPVLSFFTPYTSIAMTIWMMWMLGICIACFLPFCSANKEVAAIKRYSILENAGDDKDLENAKSVEIIRVDLKSVENSRRVRWYHFLPQMLVHVLSIGILLTGGQNTNQALALINMATFTFCTLTFWVMAVVMDRQKSQVISRNSTVNLNYARAKKNIWKNLWVLSAWLNAIYSAILCGCIRMSYGSANRILILTIIEVLAMFAVIIWFLRVNTKVEQKYAPMREAILEGDQDQYWICGMFYYNRNDRHSMVEKRMGIGTTMNMARPAGKWMTGIGAVAILTIPIMCVWLIFLEFTPIQLSVNADTLVGTQMRNDYVIQLEDIEDLTLAEESMEGWNKIVGTGMDHLWKGSFENGDMERYEVFLNPENQYFIRFEADGTRYLMSSAADSETKEIYEKLQEFMLEN